MSNLDPDAHPIIELHDTLAYQTLSIGIKCGNLLYRKKQSLPHGEWLSWVKKNLPFSDRTASRYILAWKNRDKKGKGSLRKVSAKLNVDLYSANERLLVRNLVKPIRVVTNRLKHLHQQDLYGVIDELHEAIQKLLKELS